MGQFFTGIGGVESLRAVGYICGPSGGIGGTAFLDVVPVATTPGEVRISVDDGGFIRSVQFLYVNNDGGVVEQPHRGLHSTDRGANQSIQLGKTAYISRIFGRYGVYVDSLNISVVRGEGSASVRVETRKFGSDGSAATFDYQAPPGYEIAGFCGRGHDLIDAIGVVFSPLADRGVNRAGVEIEEALARKRAEEEERKRAQGPMERSGPIQLGEPGPDLAVPTGAPDEEPVEEAEVVPGQPDPSNPPPANEPPPEDDRPMQRSGGPIRPT